LADFSFTVVPDGEPLRLELLSEEAFGLQLLRCYAVELLR